MGASNPDEIQQCYLMTGFHTATSDTLKISLMQGVSTEMMKVNTLDDPKRWWEVIDRTTGAVCKPQTWECSDGDVVLHDAIPYHEYTVSFLAYLMWDPVHMYNSVINDWRDTAHQITFDVRQPKSRAYSLKRLETFILEHPHVDVIRFTTFFHQFTLVFDALRREKYVDWFGYSASVSPCILEKFEDEVGYRFRAEYIVDQGYFNNQYRVPSREYKDFMAFQRKEVCALAKEFVDLTHRLGKEAMMFLGDHWIGTEPYMPEFESIGLDAVVGSVGNGATLRLISEIQGVRYTEGRLLPYFFPDTFYEGAHPEMEAKKNWMTARRAMLRKPLDRIGYGGYLKLAYPFKEFMAYGKQVCDEFRTLHDQIGTPYCHKTVAVLNAWGKSRSWGCHMVHHALYQKQNRSYAGVIEALSGLPFDVKFISFDDVVNDPVALKNIDVVLNIGDADTAHTGGHWWENVILCERIKQFVHQGGGFIGVGQPSGHLYQGRYLQLAALLGVELENGFTLGYDKYNWTPADTHFITEDCATPIDFGFAQPNIYALEGATVIRAEDLSVQAAVNAFGQGRCVYFGGLPYSMQNTRMLHRAILWACHDEQALYRWFSQNLHTELHAYDGGKRYCVSNNTFETQTTLLYDGQGKTQSLRLEPCQCRWF